MLKKTIDIFIRREVVDAHEMGIFLYPEHCSYTNIIYSLRLPLPKSLPHFRVCLLIFEQRDMAAVLFSAYLLKNQ